MFYRWKYIFIIQKSIQHKDTLIPGYTHLQIAMPSSIGLWLGAYAESLVDDMEFVNTVGAVKVKFGHKLNEAQVAFLLYNNCLK